MDTPGVVELFLADVIDRVWRDAVPDEIKSQMAPLADDFVRSFCLSRAVPDVTTLSDPEQFARAVQYAMVIAY